MPAGGVTSRPSSGAPGRRAPPTAPLRRARRSRAPAAGRAGIHAPGRPAQRLAEGELRARALEGPRVALQCDRAQEVPVAPRGSGHAAGPLEQALDPGLPDAGRVPLELRERGQRVSRAVEMHRDVAGVARPARRERRMRDPLERFLGRLVAAEPDLVQRRCVSGDRGDIGQPVLARERARLARGRREARRVPAHGRGARDVCQACGEDRRLARFARQARALVGGGRRARQATRVVVGGGAQHEEERQGLDHRRAAGDPLRAREELRREPLVAEQARRGDAVGHQAGVVGLAGRPRRSRAARPCRRPGRRPRTRRSPRPRAGSSGSQRRRARRSSARARRPRPAGPRHP